MYYIGPPKPQGGGEMATSSKGSARRSDKRKQSLYFPEDMLQEIIAEAARLDRSLSWIMQRAWQIARKELRKIPSVNDYIDTDEGDEDKAEGSS
jgi:uncharacterized small protein (TIGR04563 family)